jgi:hypothetical protein
MSRLSRLLVVVAAVLAFGPARLVLAGQPLPSPPEGEETAFVNVNTITLNDDAVRRDQVVLVRRGRIVAMGSRSQIPVPTGATVIEGGGRYLVPGLTDSHVHLDGDGTRIGTSRDDFGDGPLYLAYGVTSIVNLRGLPQHLEWRRRVDDGTLIGPTIYTAGDFVNEPRVVTPDDVRRDIESQVADGYDLIKFREVYSREAGFLTTEGLSLESYRRLSEVARELGVPVTGHAPVNLGLDALLDSGQTLAHIGALSEIHFLPMLHHPMWIGVTAMAFFALTVIAVTSGLATMTNRWRVLPPPPRAVSRVRELAGLQLLAAAIAAASAILFLPGGPLFESATLRVVFTVMLVLVAAATTAIVFAMVTIWSEHETSRAARVQAVVASVAGVALAWAAFAFWVPVIWRSSDRGIDRVAGRLRDAGITVQTTLVAYDAVGGPGRRLLASDPAIDYLDPAVRARWRRLRPAAPRLRYTDFVKKLAGALHRAGVPLVAGTDAMGYPLVTPGSSLHRELELLVASGLSPYEALRTATVEAARFLRRPGEFGRIAPRLRADLILVDGNPLEDIARLREPFGVMVRGRWYAREELRGMLADLAADSD